MASKDVREQKPAAADRPAKKRSEIEDKDLDKVSGGMTASGLPTGKRMHKPFLSADPCEGGE